MSIYLVYRSDEKWVDKVRKSSLISSCFYVVSQSIASGLLVGHFKFYYLQMLPPQLTCLMMLALFFCLYCFPNSWHPISKRHCKDKSRCLLFSSVCIERSTNETVEGHCGVFFSFFGNITIKKFTSSTGYTQDECELKFPWSKLKG